MSKQNILDLLKIDNRCGQVLQKLWLASATLENKNIFHNPKADASLDQSFVLKNWFHILTCVNCRLSISEEMEKVFSKELMLDSDEPDLWKLPFYAMNKRLLPLSYVTEYIGKHGKDSYLFYASLLDEEDVEKVERLLNKEIYKFWFSIIRKGWRFKVKNCVVIPRTGIQAALSFMPAKAVAGSKGDEKDDENIKLIESLEKNYHLPENATLMCKKVDSGYKIWIKANVPFMFNLSFFQNEEKIYETKVNTSIKRTIPEDIIKKWTNVKINCP